MEPGCGELSEHDFSDWIQALPKIQSYSVARILRDRTHSFLSFLSRRVRAFVLPLDGFPFAEIVRAQSCYLERLPRSSDLLPEEFT